ncbi:hypothetical protein Bca52824_067238 [Brassica carinata]|uniref:EF-hand domain-containing protein n=1 Tax=Brassica carinata TaxID=52824 RepID=A0A8X7QMZ5_BRACI|nr:hypothetical protein Bca52824_067238 [Brassica carinata]
MEIDSVAAGSCSYQISVVIYSLALTSSIYEFALFDNNFSVYGVDEQTAMDALLVWVVIDAKRQGYLGLKEFIVAMQVQRSIFGRSGCINGEEEDEADALSDAIEEFSVVFKEVVRIKDIYWNHCDACVI